MPKGMSRHGIILDVKKILARNLASKDHFELKFEMNQNRGLNASSHFT